jgi:CheY-like chemotaxis protein
MLLVEDSEESREGLSRYLRRKGYEILLAVDGRQGVEVARAEVPDLILIDLSLPVVDGWEATRQLKAGSVTRGIPVIALTAHAMAGDRERALEAGCDDYDTKPIDFSRLLTKIESLLEKKAQPAPQPEARRHLRRL